jgi:hypothetical protein
VGSFRNKTRYSDTEIIAIRRTGFKTVVGRLSSARPLTPGNDTGEPSCLRSALPVQGMMPVSCQIVGDCPASKMQLAITIKIATQNRAIGKPNPPREKGTDDRCSLNCRVFAIVVGIFKSFVRVRYQKSDQSTTLWVNAFSAG